MATTRVDVRFEPELWRLVEEFMRTSRTETASDAVRMLVEVGLPRAGEISETMQRAMRRACEREAAKKIRALADRLLGGASPDALLADDTSEGPRE